MIPALGFIPRIPGGLWDLAPFQQARDLHVKYFQCHSGNMPCPQGGGQSGTADSTPFLELNKECCGQGDRLPAFTSLCDFEQVTLFLVLVVAV